jgi:hypothetical protein
MTPNEIIREFYDADHAYRMAIAKAISRDEWVALPQDVREARAALEVEVEAQRLVDTRSAYEVMKADREERWIASHEDMYGVRRLATDLATGGKS